MTASRATLILRKTRIGQKKKVVLLQSHSMRIDLSLIAAKQMTLHGCESDP